MGLYILDGHTPVPTTDYEAWGEMFRSNERIVRVDIFKEVKVSTVFLGIDHGHGINQKPVLFETLVFGGKEDGYMLRYHTWEEAVEGHKEVVKLALSSIG